MINLLTEKIKTSSEDARVEYMGNFAKLCAQSKSFSQKFYGNQKVFTYVLDKELETEAYLVISYFSQGLRRQYVNRMPLVYGITEDGDIPLVCFDDMILDNREHTVCVKTEKKKYNGIKISFSIDRRKEAHLTIKEMYVCSSDELPLACSKGKTESSKDFKTVDLSLYYNGEFTYTETDSIVDGGRFFDSENVSLYEIPFSVKIAGNNMIVPPPAPKENDDVIDNFGVPVVRKLCRPISRDSVIEIPVSTDAKEIFFIMSLSGKRHQRWGFAQDGTVLGTITGEVYMPLLVEDTVGFITEVIYENGERDTHLPLNLSLGRHGVSGDVSVYGIPANGNKIEKIIFHNRLLDTDISLMALTLNETEERLRPEMLIPEKEEQIKHIIGKEKGIEINGNILSIKNCALVMEIDVSSGMKLLKMKNEFIKEFTVKESDMLKLRYGDDYDSVFELLSKDVNSKSAQLLYKKGGLYITIDVTLGENNDVRWQLKAENRGDLNEKCGIVFPCVTGMNHSSWEDNWYFVPKYQNILSNETVFIYEESSPNFPMQFMDVFSPKAQGGLSLTTEERNVITRKYGFEKNERGMEFYVEYPEMYGEIKVGEEFTSSPMVLTAHEGDWRKSFEIYKNWLDSWYEPYNCQNKEWYRRCFWLLTEYHDFVVEKKPISKLPYWNDTETGELRFETVLEEQKKISGCYPDILHLWASWTYDIVDGKRYNAWGNWGDEDYEVYGGREKLRDALHKIKNEKDINISLYFHPTLISEKYKHLAHYLEDHKAINDIGDTIKCGPYAYRMCHASEDWRKYAISVYPRVYKDLGIPLMYIDEFSLRCENRCYADNHGHSIPSNLLKTDYDFITELKHEMPEEVVLYGEYAAVDIYAKYIDCNISYYLTDNVIDMIEFSWKGGDGDDRLSRIYPNMYKFAFPKIVQLALPSGMRHLSWHPQKFIFFNGDAVYDSMWDCEESVGQEFNTKSFLIKKKYADCFASDTPEGFVDTLSPAICANCFPGEGRTIYTIYNRAYSTYRGKILKVKHTDGAKYYDAWNEKELKVEIKDGYAEIYLTVDAQEMGCVEVRYND